MSRNTLVDAESQSPPASAAEGLAAEGLAAEPSAEDVANGVYSQLRRAFGPAATITPANAMTLVIEAMELCEQIRGLAGPKRKKVATEVVFRMLEDIPADTEGREVTVAAVKLLLPSVIDAIVSAAKGQVQIAKAAAATKKCCRNACLCM